MDHSTQQYETTVQHVSSPQSSSHAQPVVSVSAVTSAVQPSYHVQVATTSAAHRTHAYKRPMPPTPRKLLSTTAAYSPRSTPPCKIPALQRVITKNGTIIMADLSAGEGPIAAPLTPPPTPEVSGL